MATAVLLLGCQPEEPRDATFTHGLLVLSGDVGDLRLTLRDADAPRGRRVTLPDPATAWISAGRTNVLLATRIDGTTYVSNPLGPDDPDWRLVEAVTTDGVPPDPPLYFGAWDPEGGAYVQLGADFAARDGLRVVVTDPALEGATEAPVEGVVPVPAAPTWVDADRVAVLASGEAGGESVVVDTTSGEATQGPSGYQLVTTSADATTVAAWRGPGTPVEVLATEAWLRGESASVRIEPPEPGWLPAVLALDGTGGRLAVSWTDDGAAAEITVHAGSRAWGVVGEIGLGDARVATVAWLR